jgi:hypothetical protein
VASVHKVDDIVITRAASRHPVRGHLGVSAGRAISTVAVAARVSVVSAMVRPVWSAIAPISAGPVNEPKYPMVLTAAMADAPAVAV